MILWLITQDKLGDTIISNCVKHLYPFFGFGLYPDPDPGAQQHPDPGGSGSETLILVYLGRYLPNLSF